MIWPWGRRRREAELDEELNGHLAMAAREHQARGEAPEEAAYAARREFGNATLVKEVTRSVWGGVWLEQTLRDLRLAGRSLRRSPGFLVVAVLALGLGLGLSTTMFGVIDAALHPRKAYANADRLFQLSPRMSVRAGKIVTQPELLRLVRERVPSLDAVVPVGIARDPVEAGAEEREGFELVVPPRWFQVVGVRLAHGRPFTPGDGDGVAVVSYEVWKVALRGRRDLSGARVTIGDRSYAVVGVFPRTVAFSAAIPLLPADEESPAALRMPLVRLKPGATQQDAVRDLAGLARILTATYASPGAPWALNLYKWLDLRNQRDAMGALQVAMVGSALAVLLIACVNLGNSMLARGLAKRRELAVLMALGADRRAAVRVMLAESALIGVVGVAIGAVAAIWGSQLLESLIPYEIIGLGFIQVQLSWRVFTLGAAAALVSGVLFGVIPAIRVAFSVHITEPLRDEAGTTTGRPRRHSPLVVLEAALALTLLMSATLLLRSVRRLRSAPSFEVESLASADLSGIRYVPGPGSRDTATDINWQQVLATARAVEGVTGVALVGSDRAVGGAVSAELAGDSTRMLVMQSVPIVSSDFLRVHRLSILEGRDFEPGDAVGNGVVILSAAAAGRLYPKGGAVGRMLKLGGPATGAPWVRIIGVARTPLAPWVPGGGTVGIAGTGMDSPPVWVTRAPGKWFRAQLLVRTVGANPKAIVALRHALRSLPGPKMVSVGPYTWMRDSTIAFFEFLTKVFVALGVVGLSLTALGVYGTLGYAVSRRMREFGVRIALGADPRLLYRMVMRDSLEMLLAGTAIGALGALAVTPLFGALAGTVQLSDAISLVIAEAVLLAVGLAAAVAPARRALRANPLDIIRAV